MDAIREILAVPFGWALSTFYNLTDSYIIAIILLTVIIRCALLPASISQQKNSAKQVRLTAKVNKIKQKYAGNQRKIQEETQALYQREGFGAANMGCMPLLIQMIVMIGLYGVIYTPLTAVLQFSNTTIDGMKTVMADVVKAAGKNSSRMIEIPLLKEAANYKEELLAENVLTEQSFAEVTDFLERFKFLGLDLSLTPDKSNPDALWLIPILAFATAMLSSIFMYMKQRKQNPEMAKNPSMGCMTFMSPFMSLVFTFMFPAGVGFYWIVSNVLSFIQQVVLTYFYSPKKVIAQQMVDETVVRRSKENITKRRAEIEKK